MLEQNHMNWYLHQVFTILLYVVIHHYFVRVHFLFLAYPASVILTSKQDMIRYFDFLFSCCSIPIWTKNLYLDTTSCLYQLASSVSHNHFYFSIVLSFLILSFGLVCIQWSNLIIFCLVIWHHLHISIILLSVLHLRLELIKYCSQLSLTVWSDNLSQ